jgi:hypothetical protein
VLLRARATSGGIVAALYVFTLVLGGGFLALSVLGDLFGGHGDVEIDGDLGGFDGDLSLDAGHVDFDLDAGGLDLDAGGLELDAGGLEVDAAHAELQTEAGHVGAKIFSIRTLFYSFFGFGAVGSLLTFVLGGGPLFTPIFAVAGGLASGALINTAFGFVRRSESGAVQGEHTFAGIQGRVTLPIRPGLPGKVIVERGGRRVEVRALPHATTADLGDPTKWRSVVVVEMEKGVALVAPVEDELLLEP